MTFIPLAFFFFPEVLIYHFVKADWGLFLMTRSIFQNHSCHRNFSGLSLWEKLSRFWGISSYPVFAWNQKIVNPSSWILRNPETWCWLYFLQIKSVQELFVGRPLRMSLCIDEGWVAGLLVLENWQMFWPQDAPRMTPGDHGHCHEPQPRGRSSVALSVWGHSKIPEALTKVSLFGSDGAVPEFPLQFNISHTLLLPHTCLLVWVGQE